jgi:hypothetical protein
MWANSVWGFVGIGVGALFGIASMLTPKAQRRWRKWFAAIAIVSFGIALLLLFIPHPDDGSNGNCNNNSIRGNGNTQNINCAAPPKWSALANKPGVQQPDGSFIYETTIQVIADSPPNNVLFTADGPGVTGIDVKPVNMTGFGSHTAQVGGNFYEAIDIPIGGFLVDIKGSKDAKPRLGVTFNEKLQ